MTKEALFEALNGLDDTHIAQAETTGSPKKRGWRIWAGLAACLALAVGVLFWQSGGPGRSVPAEQLPSSDASHGIMAEQLPLSDASHGVTVRYGSSPASVPFAADLAPLTEEELFTEFDTAIFLGTVTRIDNIVLDFDGSENYRALAQVRVETAYRGPYQAGDAVTVLLPCPIGDIWTVEDTGVISHLAVGTRGIFMPMVYDETSVWEQKGATLALRDIAECGLPDGERFAFLETADGLTFARQSYPSIQDAARLEEIADYILERIAS